MTTRVGSSGTPRPDAGFTLLEVIVALAILGTAVVASIQGFAGGLRLLKLAGDHQQAILLADQKLREVTIFEDGKEEGTEGPFTWERTIQAQATAETRTTSNLPGVIPTQNPTTPPAATIPGVTPGTTTVTGEPRWKVFRVDVKVRWGDRRSVELATLRTESTQKISTTGPSLTTTAPTGTATNPRATTAPTGTATNPRATPAQ